MASSSFSMACPDPELMNSVILDARRTSHREYHLLCPRTEQLSRAGRGGRASGEDIVHKQNGARDPTARSDAPPKGSMSFMP